MRILVSLLTLGSLSSAPLQADEAPRYLLFNIAPGAGWNQDRPETFTRVMFDSVAETLRATENPRLRIGLSFVFSTLETPTNVLAQSLRRLLASSEGGRRRARAVRTGRTTRHTIPSVA